MTGPLPAADPALIRGVAFLAPVLAIAALAAIGRPTRTDAAAAVVATAWSAVALVPVNAVAVHAGWWTFHAEGAVMRGLPVDLWIGWALLWGALPALLLRDLAAPLVVGVLVWLDLILMPLAAPVVRLGPHWMAGDLAAIATALVPAVLLARWTRRGERLGVRVAAQAVLAAALGFGLPLYLLDVRRPGRRRRPPSASRCWPCCCSPGRPRRASWPPPGAAPRCRSTRRSGWSPAAPTPTCATPCRPPRSSATSAAPC
jgi:hypothetical protein